jgi:hypothetical protein
MLMGSRTRLSLFGALGAVTLVAAILALAEPAGAAFPGRNGLLAVQPLKGSGVVLVKANGSGKRLLCQASSACGVQGPLKPSWSPDGYALAVSAADSSGSSVIYLDGCFACSGSPPGQASFMSNTTLLTDVGPAFPPRNGPPDLVEFGIDGVAKKVLLSQTGAMSDPVWSARGELAVVRGAWIWVGRPGKLRRLTRGSAPAWSPDGKQIAFARGGWVRIGPVRHGLFRRLVQGSAPAWSPDGRWIALFGRSHRLNLIHASGGHARHLATVTGRTVDWQPLAAKPPPACLTPPGSTVIASSSTAIVSLDHTSLDEYSFPGAFFASAAVMGCLRADGRERLLPNYNPSLASVVGHYAALVTTAVFNNRTGGNLVAVLDLRTGRPVPARGGESADCSSNSGSPSCESSIDRLVLGSDAVSAAHSIVRDDHCTCTVEQIQASDGTGVHTLDSITEPDGTPTALTNLTLTGDTLTWQHNGTPRSAQLQP